MIELSDDTLDEFILCDAELRAISWEDGGRDLRLRLTTGDDRPVELRCRSAHDVCIDLRSKRHEGGFAVSWECRFERVDDEWRMVFEFPPRGSVELLCHEAQLGADESA